MTCWIILYADDIVIITHSETKLQEMLNILQGFFADWGVEINGPKAKIMQVGAQGSSSGAAVLLNGGGVECVPMFKYLGSYCSNDLSTKVEIDHKVSSAAYAFKKLRGLNVWNDLSIIVPKGIKCILHKVIVRATLLQGCEIWAVPEYELSRLEVFQVR